ncbi:MAG: PASTA domain-containing protein [Eggerthellaceae bacterium]|nr:PASTA domain-containing protein [Eggerthellaceae bacterium]
MICKACGYDNNEDSQFCSQCGFPLSIEEGNLVSDTLTEDVDRLGLKNGAIPYVIEGLKTGQFPSSLHTERSEESDDVEDSDGDEDPKDDDSSNEVEGETLDEEQDATASVPEEADAAEDTSETHDAEEAYEEDVAQAIPSDAAQTVAIADSTPESDDGDTVHTHDIDASDDTPSTIDGRSEPLGAEVIPAFLRDRRNENEDIYETIQNLPDTAVDAIPPLQATAVMPPISTKGAIRYSTGDRDKKDAHRRRMPKLPMLVAAVVAVLALLGAVQFLSNATFGVEVPDVVGMSSDAARYELLNAGFQVDTKSQLTQDNFGIVLSSDPAAGAKKKEGSTVTITVSASRTIPDVIGMDVEAAKTKLQEEGAELVLVVSQASNQPENTVISVEPAAGEAFNPQDEITLTVASHATVPNVVGMQEEDAKAAVEEAGYVAEVKWADSDADAGTVISTTPEYGTNANLNSTVEIYVASPGPRDIYHLMDYYDATPENDSLYLQWKGFSVVGSYTYGGDDGAANYASEMWQAEDGTTISFTPVPYSPDAGLSYEDYLAEGFGFEGMRLYIPSNSSLSLTTDISMDTVQAYADACGFGAPEDTCSIDDVEADNGVTGKDLGLPAFICSQGETDNGYIWTILVTEGGTYIGCGPESCYEDMDPICDDVAINEMYS